MLKGTDILGKAVIDCERGVRVERVRDLVFDPDCARLAAFLVDEGGWFRSARVLPFDHVYAIGSDAVLVLSAEAIVPADRVPRLEKILEIESVLKGTCVLTTDGRELGRMRDLYFDERTGEVEGFEASGGMFAAGNEAKAFIPMPATMAIGEEVIFVPPETAELMQEQPATPASSAQAGSISRESGLPPLDAALGRRAYAAVRTPEGGLVVAPGQIVTGRIVSRARAYAREAELLSSVGLLADEAFRRRNAVALLEAGSRFDAAAHDLAALVREGSAEVRGGALHLWHRAKEVMLELKLRLDLQEDVTFWGEEIGSSWEGLEPSGREGAPVPTPGGTPEEPTTRASVS